MWFFENLLEQNSSKNGTTWSAQTQGSGVQDDSIQTQTEQDDWVTLIIDSDIISSSEESEEVAKDIVSDSSDIVTVSEEETPIITFGSEEAKEEAPIINFSDSIVSEISNENSPVILEETQKEEIAQEETTSDIQIIEEESIETTNSANFLEAISDSQNDVKDEIENVTKNLEFSFSTDDSSEKPDEEFNEEQENVIAEMQQEPEIQTIEDKEENKEVGFSFNMNISPDNTEENSTIIEEAQESEIKTSTFTNNLEIKEELSSLKDPNSILAEAIGKFNALLGNHQSEKEKTAQEIETLKSEISELKSKSQSLLKRVNNLAEEEDKVKKMIEILESQKI